MQRASNTVNNWGDKVKHIFSYPTTEQLQPSYYPQKNANVVDITGSNFGLIKPAADTTTNIMSSPGKDLNIQSIDFNKDNSVINIGLN